MGRIERSRCYAAIAAAALLISSAALAVQSQGAEDTEDLFRRIKARASEHLAQLPNYTCHETIERMMRIRGSFQHMDTVELEVAFVGNQELFARPGEDRFGEQPIERMVSGGTIHNGALGSHIDLVFAHDMAEFRYAGAGKKDGHKTIRYDLHVPIERSSFRVRHNGAEGMAGYDGSVWVDADTLDLVRVEFKVNRIPAHIGVHLIEESLRYRKLTIGNSEFFLPDRSELGATDSMGNYSLNMIKLDRCREYGADSVVKFGAPTQGTASRERQDR
jgi:hypothetical protein